MGVPETCVHVAVVVTTTQDKVPEMEGAVRRSTEEGMVAPNDTVICPASTTLELASMRAPAPNKTDELGKNCTCESWRREAGASTRGRDSTTLPEMAHALPLQTQLAEYPAGH